MRRRLGLIGVIGFLAACAEKAPQDTFEPQGGQARSINDLAVWVFIAAGVVGVLVFVGIAWVLIQFRARRDDDRPDPVQVHGNLRLETLWTVVPFLILLPFSVLTIIKVLELADEPEGAMVIDVYGQQWWWSYEYDLGGDERPEIITANDLVFPAGEEVVLRVHSRDVIHSFWIPGLAGTRDVVPGRIHELVIEADNPGYYDGQCKEFCGLSHANMRARAVALSQEDWKTWLDQQQQPAALPTEAGDPVAFAGMGVFRQLCSSCHQINGLEDADGTPIEVEGQAALVALHAPNLTHFMSRSVFASGEFDLYATNPESKRVEPDIAALEAWLRDPPGQLPMSPDDGRGMPNLNLTDQQIDQLVRFLTTLGPPPPLPPRGPS